MSSIYTPTFDEMLAVSHSRGADSEAPELWDDLELLLPLAEGGGVTAYDLSGDNEGTLTNMDPATDWVVTEKGWALDLVGASTQYIDISPFGFTGYPFTLWAEAYPTIAAGALMSLGKTSAFNLLYGMGIDGSGRAFIFARNTSYESAVGSVSLLNAWHTLVSVFWSDTVKEMWVDGKLVATLTTNVTYNAGIDRLRISGYADSTPDYWYNGRVVQAGAVARGLVSSQIQQLHTDPDAMLRLRSRVPVSTGAAPGGLSIPVAMHHYSKNITAA